ncbi:MAG: hypothetical protein KTR13_06145 [Saprospiraceae bacterium]|nr:hypothetical protein [Saprospiraceae bacterium]
MTSKLLTNEKFDGNIAAVRWVINAGEQSAFPLLETDYHAFTSSNLTITSDCVITKPLDVNGGWNILAQGFPPCAFLSWSRVSWPAS